MTRQYTLLGKLAIADNGRSSAIMNYKKGCALLAYLIVTRQTHSREVVADLLWEATSTAKAFHSLRALLYKLRPFTPELVVNAKQVSFQAAGEITIDLYTLAAALSDLDNTELDAALALYKGDLLDGFFLDDAPRFGEWLLLAREQLRQRVWAGYRRLCAAYAAANEWPKGIAAAHRWLQLDNLDEEIQRQLMQFLAANGQVEAALAQYERCCQLLAQELGVEPEAATTAAAAQLQQLLLPAADQLAEPGPLPARSYLPYHRNRVFTGRAAYLKQLAEVLLPETGLPKTAVISGMGGLGKTQLAVEYAYRYGRYYSGGVYWISFAEEENVSEVIAGIGGSRGMKLYQPADKLTLAEQVARVQAAWQESVPRLLIFDNCEDELPAAAWLPVSGGCSVLITSRRGHWSPEMPLQEIPLAALSITESVIFLQQLAGQLSSPEAAAIAKEVGSLPLALQLAGHYLARQKQVSPQDYLVQLREEPLLRHDSLQGKFSRYSPTGHELHVARTFAVSFDQLKATECGDVLALRLLAQIICLAPNEPIPLTLLHTMNSAAEAAYAVNDKLQTGVERLLSLGFLGPGDNKNVIMHRLLVLFSRDHLADELLFSEAQNTVEATLIHQLAGHRETDDSLVTLPFSAAHLRHVTNQSLAQESENAASLAALMGEHLITIAEYEEALSYLKAALSHSKKQFGPNSLQRAKAAVQMGSLLQDTGHYKEAEPYYLEALTIHQNILGDNHLDTATTLNKMGTLRLRIGPYQTAAPYFEQALAIREHLLGPEHSLTLGVVNNLGAMHNFMGEPDQAQIYFARVLAVRQKTLGPDHLLTATTLNNLGDLLARNGQEQAGRPYLEQAVVIREKQLGKDHPLTLACKTNLGLLLSRIGEFEEARACLDQALAAALAKIGEMHPLTARILNTLGILFTESGQYDTAIKYLEHALKIREQVRGRIHSDTAYSLICLGKVYVALQDEKSARPFFEQALAILEETVAPTAPDRIHVQAQLTKMQA